MVIFLSASAVRKVQADSLVVYINLGSVCVVETWYVLLRKDLFDVGEE